MVIRDSVAEFGETAARAGNAADRGWSTNAMASDPSREGSFLHVWFDGNREAVENNTFFYADYPPSHRKGLHPPIVPTPLLGARPCSHAQL
jgi:hypothetical protein